MSQPVTALVIMGVAGCGKTSVSEALCRLNGATAIEGDSFHPAANIEKMSAGHPSTTTTAPAGSTSSAMNCAVRSRRASTLC